MTCPPSTLPSSTCFNAPNMVRNFNGAHTSSYETYQNPQSDFPTSGNISYENEFSEWAFDNNDQWETMFANAGYRIYDGVFIPGDVMPGAS